MKQPLELKKKARIFVDDFCYLTSCISGTSFLVLHTLPRVSQGEGYMIAGSLSLTQIVAFHYFWTIMAITAPQHKDHKQAFLKGHIRNKRNPRSIISLSFSLDDKSINSDTEEAEYGTCIVITYLEESISPVRSWGCR